MPDAPRWASGMVVTVLAALLVALSPGAARADGALVSADPAADAVLAAAPTEVTLTFSGDVEPELSHVAVLDADNVDVADGDYRQPEPGRVRLPVRIDRSGDFTLAYHVTFADGTTVTGAHRFSVGTNAVPAPLDSAARRASEEAVTEHAHTIDGLSAILLVVDGVVLLGFFALLWLRPRDGRPRSLRSSGQI